MTNTEKNIENQLEIQDCFMGGLRIPKGFKPFYNLDEDYDRVIVEDNYDLFED